MKNPGLTLQEEQRKEQEMKYYLIMVWGDVEPGTYGPYPTEEKREEAAKELRREHGDKHGIYAADVEDNGELTVYTFSGAFFGED